MRFSYLKFCLNFKNTHYFFSVCLLLGLSLEFIFEIPLHYYVCLYVLYSALFFYGCFVVEAHFFSPLICSKKTTQKLIALSFDDGPDSKYTLKILTILKHYKVKAAFFCIGKHAAQYPQLLQYIHRQGHLIGNHSYSHKFSLPFRGTKKILSDLQRTDRIISDTIGLTPIFFRPPFGVTNIAVAKAISQGGYIPIGWNARSFDTSSNNEQKLLDRAIRLTQSGAIFLFHDTQQNTVNILPDFLQYLHDHGYKVVRLDEMLQLNAYRDHEWIALKPMSVR